MRLQVVGAVAGDRPTILQESQFGQVDLLPEEAQGGGQAVIRPAFDGAALHVQRAAPGQIAQRSPGMSLEVEVAGKRQILAGHGQQIAHRCVLHLGSGVDRSSVIESLPAAG